MRATALFLLLAALLGAGCARRPAASSAAAEDVLHEIVPAERAARLEFRNEMRKLLITERFDRLQAVADSLREHRSRFADDHYALLDWVNAFDLRESDGAKDPATWDAATGHLAAWRRAYPNAPLADVALAHLLVNRAWQARGGGWARTVSDSGANEFEANMGLAHAALDHAAKKGPRTLEWYFAAQRVAVGEGWEPEDAERLFTEAQAQDSTCEWTYCMRANYLLPRWYGEDGEWEAWLTAAVKPLPPDEADRIYARTCSYLGGFHRNLFTETDASWPRMRQGWLVLMKRHPEAIGLQQEFCKDAAFAGDAGTARVLFRMIGPRVDLEVWRTKRLFADVHLRVQEALEGTQAASR